MPSGTDFVGVTSGVAHSCAWDSTGTVECWGTDYYDVISDTPTSSGYFDVSAGDYHSCAVDPDREIDCWGDDAQSQVSGMP